MINTSPHILCPVCGDYLEEISTYYACKNQHNFDKAKEGYLNLMLSNAKNSKEPGDNKIMVNARNSFLKKGYYQNLATTISNIINSLYCENISILDAGVGTGFYLDTIIKARNQKSINSNISNSNDSAIAIDNIDQNYGQNNDIIIQASHKNKDIQHCDNFFGVDISKFAVRLSSKQNPTAKNLVASVFNLPFLDNSFDLVTCIFSPHAMTEYSRVLKPNGKLILVTPRKEHLKEIREILYPENVREVEGQVELSPFAEENSTYCTYNIDINSKEDILSLVEMTPYFYKTSKSSIQKLQELSTLHVSLDFSIQVLKNIK